MTNNIKEINDVQNIISQLLPLVDEAENKFKKARNWGFIDVLGGGLIVDLFKHSNLNSASNLMNRINILLHTRMLKAKLLHTTRNLKLY